MNHPIIDADGRWAEYAPSAAGGARDLFAAADGCLIEIEGVAALA